MRRCAVPLLAVVVGCGGTTEAMSGDAGSSGTSSTTGSTITSAGTLTTSAASSSASGDETGEGTAALDTTGSGGTTTTTTGESTNASSGDGSTTAVASTGSSSSGASSEASSTGALACEDLDLPEVAPPDCSTEAMVEADLEFFNDCENEVIEVFWIDYACNEMPYQVVSPGNSWAVASFVTHPWRVRAESDGRLMLEVPPLDGDTMVTVP